MTIPEDIDSQIDAITAPLGFDATVATIDIKVPPIISSIFYSSLFQSTTKN